MKIRMAENSLFAVLLRSPWWVSFAVAIALVAVVHALLPQDLRVVGSLGAVPFAVIGCIAFWRQLRALSPAQVQALLDSAADMGWPAFESALREGFAREGWQVGPGGPGADLVLERGGRTVLVAARRWKAARHGEDALQPLQSAMRQREAGGMYVALGEVSQQGQRLARESGIELVRGPRLAALLRGTATPSRRPA
jgi:restriction system protein